MYTATPACTGAVSLKSGGFETQHNRTTDETQYQPGSDECISHLHRALRAGRIARDSWGHGFTLSLLRRNKRRGWKPSPKRLRTMRRLLAELAEPDDSLIDEGDV